MVLPQSGSGTDSLSARETKELADALRARAEKIRRGAAPRDASSYVQLVGKEHLPDLGEGTEELGADFDDPDAMEQTASFLYTSGGITLSY